MCLFVCVSLPLCLCVWVMRGQKCASAAHQDPGALLASLHKLANPALLKTRDDNSSGELEARDWLIEG